MPPVPAFLSNTAGKGPVTITPWNNVVADYGADPTGVANSTTAFNNAINDSNQSGYAIYIPAGKYNIGAPLQAITRNGVHVRGDGLSSVIQASFQNGDIFTLGQLPSGVGQFITVQNLAFESSVFRTGGYDIVSKSSNVRLLNLYHKFSFGGIYVQAGSETVVDNVVFEYFTGNTGVYVCSSESGIVGSGTFGCRFKNLVARNPYIYPITNQAVQVKGNWTSGATYAANNIVRTTNWTWQVAEGGTSGTSAPAEPSANTWYNSNVSVTGGTATFRAICRNDLTWFYHDARAYSMTMLGCNLVGGDVGIKSNVSNTTLRSTFVYTPGDTIPTWIFSYNTEIADSYSAGVSLERGYGYMATNPCIRNVINGNGITIDPQYAGEVLINGGRIVSCANNGIFVNGCPDFKISGNFFARNGMLAALSATYTANDITVTSSANSRGFTIIGNNFGFQNNLPDRYTAYAISVGSLANNYAIIGNMTRGNRTGNYLISPSASAQRIFTNNANT
jgi:hypothetical protein